MKAVDLIVPGPIDQLTGGYIYDRRIFAELGATGWTTSVHALDPSFPEPTAAALAAAAETLAAIPDGRRVVVDGLALAGLGPLLETVRARLTPVALIHHPLELETGLEPAARERLRASETAALGVIRDVIVTSGWTRRALAVYGVDPGRIDVVEPGTDRPEAATVKPAGSVLRLLTVGSVTPRKGHDLLIEALARVADREWTLRCAGSLDRDPATAAALRKQIVRAGLADRVMLLGEKGPAIIAREYRDADLFVLASRLEGYGMVIAEAVAHGLAVVATAAGAIGETLPAHAGVLVPPGDASALATSLATVMDDRARLAELTEGARRAAATIPTWQASARRFAAILEALDR